MPYSAGTIVLQVVPSYLGFQDENEKMAKALAKSLDESLEKGASSGAKKAASRVNEILGEELGKDSDKSGQKAAENYAGAFRTSLEKSIKSMERELKPIELRTASSKTLDDIAKVKAELEGLSKTKIEPGMDVRGLQRQVAEVTALIEGISKNAEIDVKYDFKKGMAAWKSFQKEIESFNPKIEIVPELKTEVIERKMGALERLIKDRLTKAGSALGDSVDKEITQIKARLATLGTKEIGVDIDAGTALNELRRIEVELAHIAATTVDIQVNADATEALLELKAVDAYARKLNGMEPKIKPDVDTKDGTRKLSLFDNLLKKVGIDGRDVANSFRFFNFAALAVAAVGSALIPIFAALSAGAVGLGVALVAGAAGLGVLAIAFSGISDAVSALNDQQDKAAKTAEDAAKRMKAAGQQVEDAQRSLARARENAAESISDAERSLQRTVQDSADRQQEAARRVADAREAATRAIEAALRNQQDAEQRLADSQRDAAQAQRDLIEARKEAAKELEDLEDKRKRNELDRRQSVIDLFNATVENQATQADPGATNLEKEQADINLKNAQLRLKELRDQQKELDDQAAKGVDNSDKVQNAQDRLTAALRAQEDAQRALADADKELTRTRLDNARSIQDALDNQKRTIEDNAEAISDAQRNLSRAQESGREAVADAQRNLQRAQENYNDSLKETSTSAEKVKEAMDALGPAGQDFATFIHSLRDDFREIRDIIQSAFLPQLTVAIQTLLKEAGPELKQFLGSMASVFGELAIMASEVFTNPDFKTFFRTIAEIAPVITKNFGKGFLQFMQAIANIAVAFAPLAVQISDAFVDWTKSFLEWTQSKEGQKTIQDFLAFVKEVAPDVKDFFKALVGAVINLARALAPYGDDLLKGITDFLDFIAKMDPKTLGAIVISILGLVAGFQALAGIISIISIVAGSTLGLIALAVFAVVAAFIYLYNTNDQFREFVEKVWPVLSAILSKVFDLWIWSITNTYKGLNLLIEAGTWLWQNVLSPFFSWLGGAISDVWDTISPLLSDIADLFSNIGKAVSFMWNKIVWPILKTLGEIAWNLYWAIMKPALEGIGTLFGKLGDAISFVWNKVISPVFGWIAEKLGIGDDMKENGGGLVGAFRAAIKLIGTIWDGLATLAKKPVDFLINTIMNNGIIAGFNELAKHLPGLKTVDPIPWPPPGFARGGIPDSTYGVRFGYTPGRDNQLVAVGGGEAILRPEATRALGPDWVNAINKRARLHGVQGVANLLQGFKTGGVVGGGDFDRTNWRGHAFNNRTVKMLQAVESIIGRAISVTQGSFSTSVSASGSTHAGGGAVDVGWPGGALGQLLVQAMRIVGFAAWHRDPSQGPWNDHIHGIAAGDPTASASAQAQVRDYYNGGNGLGGRDDGPNVAKDPNFLERIGGTIGGMLSWVTDAISSPIDWLKGKISGKLEQLIGDYGDNTLVRALKAIPEAVINGMAQMISGAFNFGGGDNMGGPIKDMVQQLALNMFGWAGPQWSAIDKIVSAESGWNPDAQNPTSSAFGLFQFLNGTWGPYGLKTADPKLQAQYGLQYIKDRYGDPLKALSFREDHGWYSDGGVVPDNGTMMYDNGGFLPPGITQVVNLTGKPEPVFTADQFERLGRGGGGSGVTYAPTFNQSDLTPGDIAQDLMFTLTRIEQGVAS